MALPFLFAEFGTVTNVWLPRLQRVGPSASLDKSEYFVFVISAGLYHSASFCVNTQTGTLAKRAMLTSQSKFSLTNNSAL